MDKRLIKSILFFTIILLFSNIVFDTTFAKISNKKNFTFDEDDLDKKIIENMESGHMPSLSACIIKDGSVVWIKSYGYSDVYKKQFASVDTIYLAGSISKTVTGTALMQLYEKGLFDLDDDVNKFLPFNLRNPKYPDVPITFRMLLAHQSSLADRPIETFLYFSLKDNPKSELKEYVVPRGTKYSPRIWRDTKPGEQSYYTSVGFEILGYLIELITNETYENYCKKNIFEPLEMNDTSYNIDDLDKNRMATPYIYLINRFFRLPQYQMDSACAAAGGLRTTVSDLSHYLIAHLNNGEYNGVHILNKSTIELMHTLQYPELGGRHGLGWQIWGRNSDGTNRIEGHVGEVPGGTTFMYVRSQENTGVILFINQFTLKYRFKELFSCITISQMLFEKAYDL